MNVISNEITILMHHEIEKVSVDILKYFYSEHMIV